MTPEQAIEHLGPITCAKPERLLQHGAVADTWLLRQNNDAFVLRIDRPLAARLGLDRIGEQAVLAAVAEAGIGPSVAAADPEHGLLVTRYLEGRVWTDDDLHEPAQLVRLGTLLRRVHSIPVTGPALDLTAAAQRYAQAAGSREAQQAAHQLHTLLPAKRKRPCLCHGDPTASNILDDGRLMLLDWEYSGLGDPLFDLAVVIRHHALDSAESDVLMAGYGLGERARTCLPRWFEVYDALRVLWSLATGT